MLSEDSELLERAFDIFNEVYFGSALPKVVITIQSSKKTYGHFTVNKIWSDEKQDYHEINISAEHLSRPIEHILATLMHETVVLLSNEKKSHYIEIEMQI